MEGTRGSPAQRWDSTPGTLGPTRPIRGLHHGEDTGNRVRTINSHPRVISRQLGGCSECRTLTSMATSAVASSDMRAAMTVLEKNRAHSQLDSVEGGKFKIGARTSPGEQRHKEDGSTHMDRHLPENLCSIPSVISIPFSLICYLIVLSV
jgi:hypothetical protein